jgi:hypothetical protein
METSRQALRRALLAADQRLHDVHAGQPRQRVERGPLATALQTGLVTGVVALLLSFTPVARLYPNRYGNALVVGVVTALGDAWAHPNHYGFFHAEAFLTGAVSALARPAGVVPARRPRAARARGVVAAALADEARHRVSGAAWPARCGAAAARLPGAAERSRRTFRAGVSALRRIGGVARRRSLSRCRMPTSARDPVASRVALAGAIALDAALAPEPHTAPPPAAPLTPVAEGSESRRSTSSAASRSSASS